jgi:uncharacterized protein YwgA
MRDVPNELERLTDKAILLSLWAKTQEHSGDNAAGDRLKLTKLAFLLEYPLFRQSIKALNMKFFRYTYGPYSEQLCAIWEELGTSGLMTEIELFTVTERGKQLANSFIDEVLTAPENKAIFDHFNHVVATYADLDTRDILDRVYDMSCFAIGSPSEVPLRKMPQFQDLTEVLDDAEAFARLHVSPGWLKTLELEFHPHAFENLQQGIEDARHGRITTIDELWAEI